MVGKLRVFLDDVRPLPVGFDVLCRSVAEVKSLILLGRVGCISFDHDLGEGELTGYDLACWIERETFCGRLGRIEFLIHSANPVGRLNISLALGRAVEFLGR